MFNQTIPCTSRAAALGEAERISMSCNVHTLAQMVIIYILGEAKTLTLCEVEILTAGGKDLTFTNEGPLPKLLNNPA